jgi:hypothetical protein
MRTLLALSFVFCITAIIIFSCSKSTIPEPATLGTVTPDSLAKKCVNVALTTPKGTDSQTVGFNTPITPIKYKISNNQSSDTTGLAAVSVSAIGLPPGITTSFIGGVLTISGSAVKDSSSPYVYVIVATGNVCSLPLTGVIAVEECATIKLTSPENPTLFQIVPTNTAITPVTFEVGGGGTGATVTGLPPGITSSFSAGVVTVSGTLQNAPDSVYMFKVTTTGGYCSVYDSAFIVVTTCPTIALTSAPGTNYQIISTIGQAIVPITFTVSGHFTRIDYGNLLPPGITAVVTGNTVTFSGTPQQQAVNGQVFWYDLIITAYTDVNSYCSYAVAYGKITIQGE